MSSLARTALTAAVSSLLTLLLVAGCDIARPLTGLGPGRNDQPTAVASPTASSASAPT